jgi:hypothetical protein
MKTDPRSIPGPWKAGFTLDTHTASSTFFGYDDRGYPKFDTVRTAVGEYLYRLKYQSDYAAIRLLFKVAADFVRHRASTTR